MLQKKQIPFVIEEKANSDCPSIASEPDDQILKVEMDNKITVPSKLSRMSDTIYFEE